MSLSIKLFGKLAEIAGASINMDNPGDTNSLVAALHARFPELAGISYLIAVNREMITTNTRLENGSIVALLPPFSGG